MGIKVSIDGPSGAGKSAIAKDLAKKLDFCYIDTGALYRAVGLFMIKNQILDDAKKIEQKIDECQVTLTYNNGKQIVKLGAKDVTDIIRSPKVSAAASKVSEIPKVREHLLEYQRNLADKKNVIMDGRDIGTVVLPNADLKIYLTASLKQRAKRRRWQLLRDNHDITFKEVCDQIRQRDMRDKNRKDAPLKIPKDAVFIDNSNMRKNETVNMIKELIEKIDKKV